jgi:hypothetical protein
MSNPTGRPFRKELLEAIATISSELSKLSNKEAKEVLTMVCSNKNLRVVPLQSAIAPNSVIRRPPGIPRKPNERAAKATPPAGWKKTSEWCSATAKHDSMVSALKKEPDLDRRRIILEDLRESEVQLKILKRKLQGFQQAA